MGRASSALTITRLRSLPSRRNFSPAPTPPAPPPKITIFSGRAAFLRVLVVRSSRFLPTRIFPSRCSTGQQERGSLAGPGHGLAGGEIETGMMQRAMHLAVGQKPVLERAVIMGAKGIDRENPSAVA